MKFPVLMFLCQPPNEITWIVLIVFFLLIVKCAILTIVVKFKVNNFFDNWLKSDQNPWFHFIYFFIFCSILIVSVWNFLPFYLKHIWSKSYHFQDMNGNIKPKGGKTNYNFFINFCPICKLYLWNHMKYTKSIQIFQTAIRLLSFEQLFILCFLHVRSQKQKSIFYHSCLKNAGMIFYST
jgi:hypothetical protein